MQYYGRFYRTELLPLLKRINTYLMRWPYVSGSGEASGSEQIRRLM
jgi:hypothetical protein